MACNLLILNPACCNPAARAARASGVPIPASTNAQPFSPTRAYILTERNGNGIGTVIFQVEGATSRVTGSGSSCQRRCSDEACCMIEGYPLCYDLVSC